MERDCQMCHSLAFETIGGTVRTLRHGQRDQAIADLRAYSRSTSTAQPPALGGMARRRPGDYAQGRIYHRSEEYTSELQTLMGNASALFCVKNKRNKVNKTTHYCTDIEYKIRKDKEQN